MNNEKEKLKRNLQIQLDELDLCIAQLQKDAGSKLYLVIIFCLG